MFISDNILVVALILSFIIISWFTYKSVMKSIPDEDEIEDESELEVGLTDEDSEFIQYAEQVSDNSREEVQKNNNSQKLSEKLKEVRPVVNLEVEPNQSKPAATKNIRVNKKIKNAADSQKTN